MESGCHFALSIRNGQRWSVLTRVNGRWSFVTACISFPWTSVWQRQRFSGQNFHSAQGVEYHAMDSDTEDAFYTEPPRAAGPRKRDINQDIVWRYKKIWRGFVEGFLTDSCWNRSQSSQTILCSFSVRISTQSWLIIQSYIIQWITRGIHPNYHCAVTTSFSAWIQDSRLYWFGKVYGFFSDQCRRIAGSKTVLWRGIRRNS